MLSVTLFIVVLSIDMFRVIMLNVIRLSVPAPQGFFLP
jgi:hypothetical protein